MTTTKEVIAEFEEMCFCTDKAIKEKATFDCRYDKAELAKFITSRLEERTKEIIEIGEKIAKEWTGAAERTEALSDLIATLKSTYL